MSYARVDTSNSLTCADDTVVTFDLSSHSNGIAVIEVGQASGGKTSVPRGLIAARTGAGYIETIAIDTTNTDLLTGDKVYTDVTDGKFGISAGTNLQFINRTGSTRYLTLRVNKS